MTLTLQQRTGAAERLREARVDLGVDWLALVEQARVHAARNPFRAMLLSAWRKRADGKSRVVTQAQPAERIIEETLRPQLERVMEDIADDTVHGYRSGRSTHTAALAVSRALAAGHPHVLQVDIRKFFDSVDWFLFADLRRNADRTLTEGLDPHPALLHESRPGHAALASDLIEPYRVLVADSFVRGLVNRRRIHADQFRRQGNGGVYLSTEGRRQVLEAFEHYMSRPSPAGTGPTPHQAMAGTASSMLHVVLGEQLKLELPPPFMGNKS